jgi:hypothetical protein
MAYLNSSTGRLEERRSKIVSHYLNTWFLIDLISIFPFDLIALQLEDQENKSAVVRVKGVKFLRAVRLLKLVRIIKALRLFKQYRSRIGVSYTTVFFLVTFAQLTFFTHLFACIWLVTSAIECDDACMGAKTEQERRETLTW